MMIKLYVRDLIARGVDPAFAAELVTAVYTLGVNSTINRTASYPPSHEPLLRPTPGNDLNRPKAG